MNKNIVIGTVIGIIIVGVAYLALPRTETPTLSHQGNEEAQATSSSTQENQGAEKKASQPTFMVGTSSVKTVPATASFDTSSFTSTSTYPLVSGTANTPRVGLVINNSASVGVVGTWEIPVTQGHWSYYSSVMLTPGSYTLLLFAGEKMVSSAKLTVTKP